MNKARNFRGGFVRFITPKSGSISSLLLAGLLTVSMLALAGCGDDAEDDDYAATETSTTGSSSSSSDVAHEVTILGFTCPFETSNINAPPKENEVLAMVRVKIVNEGDEDYEVNPNRFTLETESGEQYLPDVLYQGDDRLRDTTLAPGEEVEGVWVFFVDAAENPTGIKEGIMGELIPLP